MIYSAFSCVINGYKMVYILAYLTVCIYFCLLPCVLSSSEFAFEFCTSLLQYLFLTVSELKGLFTFNFTIYYNLWTYYVVFFIK